MRHCRKRGVIIGYVKAFQLLSNYAKANCKITVNESDLWKVESNTFWPEYFTVREWLPRPLYNAANIAGNGSDDDFVLE